MCPNYWDKIVIRNLLQTCIQIRLAAVVGVNGVSDVHLQHRYHHLPTMTPRHRPPTGRDVSINRWENFLTVTSLIQILNALFTIHKMHKIKYSMTNTLKSLVAT